MLLLITIMKSAYLYDEYSDFLRDSVVLRKKTYPSFTLSRVADQIGVQRSYLSNVLHRRCDLNADQLYSMAQALHCSVDESDFLLLLLEIKKCRVKTRMERLETARDQWRDRKIRTDVTLGRKGVRPAEPVFAEYFTHAVYPLAHMFLTQSAVQASPALLAERLRVEEASIEKILSVLEKCGVVRLGPGKKCQVLSSVLHLSSESHLVRAHGIAFRQKSIEYQQKLGNHRDYFFTSSFSANDELRAEIKARFLEFLKWVADRVEKAPASEVFHMNFDLFKI